MKREIAATILSTLLAGTALAGPIESSALPPPAQNQQQQTTQNYSFDETKLRGFLDSTAKDRHVTTTPATLPAQNTSKGPAPQIEYDTWIPSAELLVEGIPESEGLSLDVLAKKALRSPTVAGTQEASTGPITYTWDRGKWRANVGADVTTPTNTSAIPTNIYAGATTPSGGTGAINGRIEYDLNTWQIYGGTKRGLVARPDGTLGVENNFTGGTFYNLPPSLLGGKVGTGFEVNPTGDAKTKLEYRRVFGETEGFLSAERSTPFQHATPDVNPVNGLKAGINRKF